MNPPEMTTLRQWYAGLAVQGILSGDDQITAEHAAEEAFRVADALLAVENMVP